MQPKHLKLAAVLKDSRAGPAPESAPPLPEDEASLPAKISAWEALIEGSSSARRNPLSSWVDFSEEEHLIARVQIKFRIKVRAGVSAGKCL